LNTSAGGPPNEAGNMNPLTRLAYSPFLAQVVVIRRCNLSCGYCNEFDETSDPVDTAALKAPQPDEFEGPRRLPLI
jgi:hypothetical protein